MSEIVDEEDSNSNSKSDEEEFLEKEKPNINKESKESENRINKKEHTKLIEIKNINLNSLISANSSHGLTGLNNLGNTCFLNSALQCLSHCEELTKYFLSKKFEDEINENNSEGTQGTLLFAYYNFLNKLWNKNYESISPSNFRKLFIKYCLQFRGFSQQDSHEVLTSILDKMHEDLNLISKKPYIEMKNKQENEKEEEASERWWNNFLMRENSIIIDLFHGQFHNKITCPKCGYVSITYEPFSSLSLPIPEGRYCIKIKFFSLRLFQLKGNYFQLLEIYANKNTRICDLVKNSIVEIKKKFLNNFEVLSEKNLEIILFGKNYNIRGKIEEDDFNLCISNLNLNKTEICLYEKTDEKSSNIYCYLSKYQIIDSFFGLIPYESIKTLFDYPIGISIKNKEKVLDIYNKIKQEIIDKIFKDADYKSKESISSKRNFNISEISLTNEKEIGFILHLRNYASNNYCDFCGLNTSNKLKQHSCLFLSRFKKNETYSYIKSSISIKNFPLLINIELIDKVETLNLNKEKVNQNFGIIYENNFYSQMDIYDCFNLFCSEEKLEHQNSWYCPKCKKFQEASKKMDIYKSPFFLIIQLKRFKRLDDNESNNFFNFHFAGKNNTLINFPISNLDLRDYVLDKKEEYKYDLIAVSQHYGSMNFGHYTAACLNNGKWYSFDDSSVNSINSGSVISPAAYLLIYKRHT